MNQIWKRTASLALSAVLLWNSVPMGAFATEETTSATEPTVVETQPETQPVETEPQVTEPQTVVTDLQVTNSQVAASVAQPASGDDEKEGDTSTGDNETDGVLVDCPVWVNEEQLANKSTSVYDYDPGKKILTLKKDVSSVYSGDDLVVNVTGEIQITGALSSNKNITITGKGQLTVGSIVAGENLKIADATVKVGEDKQEGKDSVNLISVKNTIEVSGDAHLVTAKGHNAVVITDDKISPSQCTIEGSGHFRYTDGSFTKVTSESAGVITTPAAYFEFVGSSHVSDSINGSNENEHYKTCKDAACPFSATVKIDASAHSEAVSFDKKDNTNHIKVNACCGYRIEELPHAKPSYSLSEDGKTISAVCDECKETTTITINADSCEYDGSAHGATVTVSDGLAVTAPEVYYLKDGATEAIDTAPTAVGKYKAYIQMGEGEKEVTAEVEFEIEPEKVDITVTVAGEYVYNGQPHEPGKEKLTVTMEGNAVEANDYSIEKYENNVNAGTAKVVVSVKNGDYNVTGEGTFTIARALKPSISDANKPKPGFIRENEDKTTGVPVLTEENKGKTDDGLALEYSWNLGSGYSTEIPTQTKNGSYWLYYRSVESGNYQGRAEGSVKVVVTPYLKATSGTKLAEVTLPTGWAWDDTSNGPASATLVGNPSREGNPFKATYTHISDGRLSATVDVKVIVEGITPVVTLERSHVRYNNGSELKPKPTVKIGETILIENTDYTLSWSDNKQPGRGTVTVKAKEGGAYQFEDVAEQFVIYRSYNASLVSNTTLSEDISATEKYNSVDKIKAELDAEVEKLGVMTGERKYYNFAMMNGNEAVAYDEYFWPNDPITVTLNHVKGGSADSSYKAIGLYTVTSERLGVEAGTVVELPVTFSTKSESLGKPQVQANAYMIVTLAAQQHFSIEANATGKGTIKFMIGDQTATYEESDLVCAGDLVTVVAEPQTNYYLAKLYYSYDNGANTTKVDIVKDANGNYTFEMPAKNIEIHAEFDEVTLNQPIVKDLTYTGQAQQLVDAAVVTEGKVTYKLHSMTEYTDNVANIKGTAAGAYKVFYRYMDSDGNIKKEDSVIAVIRPKVGSVEYGKTLNDVKLPDGFDWNMENPKTNTVGNVGKNTFFADFSPKDVPIVIQDTANQVDKSKIEVEIEVQPKAAAPAVTLTSDHVKYESGKDNKAEVTVKIGTETLKQDVDYELVWKNVTKPGIATVTVKGINYTFEDISKTYYIYQPKYDKLDSTTVELSDDLVAANYTKDSIKTKLSEQFDEAYPELNRSFFNCAMADSEDGFDYDIDVWPKTAVTFYLDYPANTDKNDTFKAFMMRSTDEGEGRTGDIEALTVTKVAVNNESKLKIELKKPAVVALAYEVKGTYEVTVAASDNGTVKFSVGENTDKKTSAEVEYGQVITVHVTPNTNYAVSKLQYTYKEGTTTKAVTVKQDDNGKYTFKMPERDITLKATFSKKTTSTKNPYSGDSSNIALWITMMAASAVGLAALVLLLIKSRKK